jgi:hypothetical protein
MAVVASAGSQSDSSSPYKEDAPKPAAPESIEPQESEPGRKPHASPSVR